MDHCEKEKRNPHPRENANILSLLTFSYIVGLLKKAFKRDLRDEDLYEVLSSCKSERCGNKFEKYWKSEEEKQGKKKKPFSLGKLIWKRWGKKYLFLGFVDFIWHTANSIFKPYAMSNLIAYFAPGSKITRDEAYFYGLLLSIQTVAHVFFVHNYNLWGQIFGTEIKTAFSSMLYRKALRLSPAALNEMNFGNIVTLITKDVHTFRMSIWVFNDLWICVTQVVTICILLYIKVGPVSFLGISILLLTIPLQAFLGKMVSNLRLKTSKKTDERLQITQEVLSTMRIIKMYTWEDFFSKQITSTRKKEITKLLLGFYLRVILILSGILFSKVGFYVLIVGCIWAGVTTDTTVILYAISNFKDLRQWLGMSLPFNIAQIGEFSSAYQRISKALKAEELNPPLQESEPTKAPLVELKEARVRINDEEILSNVSFSIQNGLTLVTGTVGSGKSSMFKAILQDYPLYSGSVITYGRISYASQDPWLFPSSIKQNILFGEKYDEKRYQEVVRVCALLFDFNLLDHGDETILTDRGLNLSKGQQARINLARAIYRDTEIYLLDDCLTALDAAVQDFIFEECIKKFLKNKICILISQTASHISEADNVIIMNNGTIRDMGSPNAKIYQEVKELAVEDDDLEKEVIDEKDGEADEKTQLMETEQFTSKKKVYKEVKKEGSIDFDVYKKYFMYGGGILMVLLNFFGGGISQTATSYSDKLLSDWIDKKQFVLSLQSNASYLTSNSTFNSTLENAVTVENETFRYYTILMFVSTFLELLKTYFMVEFCRRSSINIHKDMIKKIMNAVMSFFDTHLIGNVLNRFSQDMVNIDERLPMVLNECYGILFRVSGGIFLIITVNAEFSIYVLTLIVVLLLLRWLYLPAGRSLKRLEAATRSPMIGHINATLEGLTTIRAFKVENLLIEEYDKHQDLHTSAYITSLSTMRGVGFFMNMLSTSLVIVVIVKFLIFANDATAGDVTLALTQVFMVGGQIQFGVRNWAELENLMTSVERLLEYTEIKSEKKDGQVVANWPSKGAVTYKNVSLSYNNTDDLVLNDLNFEIEPKQKIGIVGRTGAGKSSIISTIFRLYETRGQILIDGIDIKSISLDSLRKNIAIIPQDPIVFSGTLRTNLDALNEFEDEELWMALEKVGIRNQFTSLYRIINSSNSNFSSGQKQLITLARAILHKNKIVVMDEATANMDHETDAALHKIIKENFSEATVLTIAHRLHSILDCDKVMVLDRGHIRELDNPRTLLKNMDGMFYKMVKQAGLLNYLE